MPKGGKKPFLSFFYYKAPNCKTAKFTIFTNFVKISKKCRNCEECQTLLTNTLKGCNILNVRRAKGNPKP